MILRKFFKSFTFVAGLSLLGACQTVPVVSIDQDTMFERTRFGKDPQAVLREALAAEGPKLQFSVHGTPFKTGLLTLAENIGRAIIGTKISDDLVLKLYYQDWEMPWKRGRLQIIYNPAPSLDIAQVCRNDYPPVIGEEVPGLEVVAVFCFENEPISAARKRVEERPGSGSSVFKSLMQDVVTDLFFIPVKPTSS